MTHVSDHHIVWSSSGREFYIYMIFKFIFFEKKNHFAQLYKLWTQWELVTVSLSHWVGYIYYFILNQQHENVKDEFSKI